MGVKGLWKIIKSTGHVENPENCTLAVDASIWVHQYKGMNESDVIYLISKRLMKLLYYNIKPIFVFDGEANDLKNKTIIKRKKVSLNNLIKDVINNKICKKCNIKLRTCRHAGIKKEEIFEEISEMDTKEDIDDLEDLEYYIKYNKHGKIKKLRNLVKLREKRKERLDVDTTNLDNFSKSQIKNIQKRNMVSHFIRQLENRKRSGKTYDKIRIPNNMQVDMHKDASDEELDTLLECSSSDEAEQTFNSQKGTSFYDFEDIKLPKTFSKTDNKLNKATVSVKSSSLGDGFFTKCENQTEKDSNEIISDHENNTIEFDTKSYRKYKILRRQIDNNQTMDFLNIESIIKKILTVFNLPFISSPSEADSQCGFLFRNRVIDGVITEDNDILLHGAVVYKSFFRKNKDILKFDPHIIERDLNLSQEDLIKLGFVLGSDYTEGIKGIGIKKAVNYIRNEKFEGSDYIRYSNIYLQPKVNSEWTPQFGTINIGDIYNFLVKHSVDEDKIKELIFYLERRNKKEQ